MSYGVAPYGSMEYAGYELFYPRPYGIATTDGFIVNVPTPVITTDGIIVKETGNFVLFNGVNLNGASFIVERTNHDFAPTRILASYKIARRDGEKLVSTFFGRKEIIISGYINGANQSEFEQLEDNFKAITSAPNGNLDISFDGTRRRYVATASEIKIDRDSYNIDWAPWSITFLVPSGKGLDVTTTVETFPDITENVYSGTFNNEGTAVAYPLVTFLVNSQTALTSISLQVGAAALTINHAFSNGDVLTIDFNTFSVQINGIEVDYNGVFPQWPTGSTAFVGSALGTARDISLTFSYVKNYL